MNRGNTVLNELRSLGNIRAPKDFVERVLRAVGVLDSFTEIESALGKLYVAWNERGIAAVTRSTSDAAFERWFRQRFGRSAERAAEPPASVRRVLVGEAGARTLRYDLSACTPFEAAVLRKALDIPRGEVRPYGWVAREIGNPKAVRAVGTALARNPIPVLIPCHRVVRS
ncbi:MAG TPA: MGMT family protein, partial [Candidatus Baltobacteraceae bacterium]|nr:MGMT family protein [Candidatus Baltobacteraceae bacterium]